MVRLHIFSPEKPGAGKEPVRALKSAGFHGDHG